MNPVKKRERGPRHRVTNEGLTEFSCGSRENEYFCLCFYFERGREMETFRMQNEFVITQPVTQLRKYFSCSVATGDNVSNGSKLFQEL